MESGKNESALIKGIGAPPRGLALLMVLGPGLVWCGEYIGSGEVVLATRTGAIFGVLVLWAPTVAIFSKFWIGGGRALHRARAMIDMLGRTPGPGHWWSGWSDRPVCTGGDSTAAGASVARFDPASFRSPRSFSAGSSPWA